VYISCVEIQIDDSQSFPLHVELALTAGCWIRFCTYMTTFICPYNYYNLFIFHLIDRYNDRILPLLGQFLLIPNENTKFMNLVVNCSSPCLKTILLGFDKYLVVCDFLAFQ